MLDAIAKKLGEPMLLDGFIYATDKSILIKAPVSRFEYTYFEKPFAEKCEAVIMKHEGCLFGISPYVITERYDKMPKKNIYEECGECEGTGQIECHCCGHETECDDCDGTGYNRNIVIGSEVDSKWHIFSIENAGYFAPEYMQFIAALAKEIECPIKCVANGGQKLQFEIGDVTVLVMGIYYGIAPAEEVQVITLPIIETQTV